MKELRFQNLSDVGNQEILDCFNTSFSDYLVPLQLSAEQFETKLFSEHIDKSMSIGAFRGNELIGFILHGHRVLNNIRTAYNAGTGVIPQERGKGLTQRMYQHIKPILIKNGITKVVLEVISDNLPAQKSYEKVGFKGVRGLSCFKGKPIILQINDEVDISEVSHVNFAEIAHFGAMKPTWQNTASTIERLENSALYITASMGSEVCGYCIFNQTNNRILQLAVKEGFRNKLVGTTLLDFLKAKIQAPISIINVDDGFTDMLRFFESRNMNKTLGQIEMELIL